VKDHGVFDKPLDIADCLAAIDFKHFGDKNEALAWVNRASKADILHASEAHEVSSDKVLGTDVIAAKLGRPFTHEDPWHEGIIGEMPTNPKFIGSNIPIPDYQVLRGIDENDAIDLFEFESLGVNPAYFFLIRHDRAGHDLVQVDLCRVEI